jgi:hypothetical protein
MTRYGKIALLFVLLGVPHMMMCQTDKPQLYARVRVRDSFINPHGVRIITARTINGQNEFSFGCSSRHTDTCTVPKLTVEYEVYEAPGDLGLYKNADNFALVHRASKQVIGVWLIEVRGQ